MSERRRARADRAAATASLVGWALCALGGCSNAPSEARPVEVAVPSPRPLERPADTAGDGPTTPNDGAEAPAGPGDAHAMGSLFGDDSQELGEALGRRGDGGTRAPRVGNVDAVRGALDKEEVRAGVRRGLDGIRACYEQRLVRQPDLQGRAVVRFVIAPSGEVVSATIESSTLGHPELESCLLGVVRGLRFPEPRGGPVIVNYPFVLQPSS